jgi:hypothetical protein
MTDTANTLDLDAIRYRLNEATPGPWGVGNGTHIVRGLEVTGPGSFTCIQSVAEIDDEDDRCDWGRDEAVETDPEADARFIAAARQDIPALLAEVLRLRDQAHAAQAVIQAAQEWVEAHDSDAGVFWSRKVAANLHDAVQAHRLMEQALDAADREHAEGGTATTEPKYLIWSHHHQAWWGPNGSGYCSGISDAGRYTLADTKQWLGRGCGCCEVPEVPVPAEQVFRIGVVVDLGQVIADATTVAIKSGDVNRYYAGAEGGEGR